MLKKKAIFLDRDGIITRSVLEEAPTKISQLKLTPQVIPVLKDLKKLGFSLVIIPNQPDITLGRIDESTKKKLKKRFLKLTQRAGVKFDGVYYCHHHPLATNPKYRLDCNCRKPRPGMIFQAARHLGLDLTKSVVVGDRASDIKTGKDANLKTILLHQANSQTEYLKKLKIVPDFIIFNLSEIFPIIQKEAVILSAGRGERMMPLSLNLPKPLIKVHSRPMIDYIIKLLSYYSFSNIGINLFYYGFKIKKYLGDGQKHRVRISYIFEKELSGTAGGVKNVCQKLQPKRPFLVIAADMLINFNLKSIYKFHLTHGGIATICCYYRPKDKLIAGKSGLILFDKRTKLIKKFIERPKTSAEIISRWVNSSVYIFDPKILNYIPKSLNGSKVVDLPKDIFPKLLHAKEKIYAYPVNRKKFYQLGIDTPDKIIQAERDLKSGIFTPVA